jgi:hypothetical protein
MCFFVPIFVLFQQLCLKTPDKATGQDAYRLGALCWSVFHHCDNQEKQFKRREALCWLTVSEVSVHGRLAPLFLAPWQRACLLHGSQKTKRARDQKGLWTRYIFPGTPPVTSFLQLGRSSYFPSPNTATMLSIHQGISSSMTSEPSGSNHLSMTGF